MSFQARYSGRCGADCGERINAGDQVQYVDGELLHEDCAELDGDSNRRMKQRLVICPSCWTSHAGECL